MLVPAPEIRYFQQRDGYRTAARVWAGEKPVARVVGVHGIVSHSGWYLPSGAHLARQGFEVHLLDRRGSGLNRADRGDVDRWDTWPSDVEQYLEHLGDRSPRILLGISWGGGLTAAVARRRPDLLAGAGLLCPGIYSRKAANAVQRAALRLAGSLGLKARRVGIPLRDPALFTNNPIAQAYIAQDPLTLWSITISFALANLELTRFATEAPGEIRVPLLAMLAGRDPITVNERVRQFAAQAGRQPATVMEYPEASHTLEFEPDPLPYLRDLTRWCRETASAAPRGPGESSLPPPAAT